MPKLKVGDLVRVENSAARYKLTAVRETEVDGYGGSRGRMMTRTFPIDAVRKCQARKDRQQVWRAAVAEVSEVSKKRKRKGGRF